MKTHMQQTSLKIDGTIPKLAMCGNTWPEKLTDNSADVTCKLCARKVKQQERLVAAARHFQSARFESWENEAHQ